MTIRSIQKVIKVGSSAGVTIPAKDLKRAGLMIGDEVVISVQAAPRSDIQKEEVVALTQQLIARHKKALKNLSQR